MINSLLIYVFCTNCKSEIVLILVWRTGRTISGSKLVQNKPVGPNGRLSSLFHFFNFWLIKNLMYLKLNLRPCGTHRWIWLTQLYLKNMWTIIKVRIYGSVLNPCIYISLHPCFSAFKRPPRIDLTTGSVH